MTVVDLRHIPHARVLLLKDSFIFTCAFLWTNLLVSLAPSELLRDKQLASLGEFDKCFICPLIMAF